MRAGHSRVAGCGRRCAAAVPSRMLRTVSHNVHEIVAEVIRQTGKDKPADAALREVLKQIKDLAPLDATAVARDRFHLLPLAWLAARRTRRGSQDTAGPAVG